MTYQIVFLSLLLIGGAAFAAPPIKAIDPLTIRLENAENTLRRLEQRVNNQDLTLNTMQTALEHESKKPQHNSEIDTLKSTSGNLVDDVKTLHDALQKTNESLKKWSVEVERLNKIIAKQGEEITNIKNSISSVVDAMSGGGEDNTNIAYHQVAPGETLGGIAQKHHTNIKTIKTINEMKNDTIYVGQKLRIPTSK